MALHRPRVLVTRSAQQASPLADRLRDLGAEPVLVPAIETVDPPSFAALDEALEKLSTFDWLLFTSANAVEAFQRRRAHLSASTGPSSSVISTGAHSAEWRDPCIPLSLAPGMPPIAERTPKLAAIGPATARALTQIGLPPDLVPLQAVAESFAEALLPHARHADASAARFLLFRAEEAREHLPETLRAAGAEVTIAPAYRTVVPAESVERIRALFGVGENPSVTAVTFTSSSTARNLLALFEAAGCTLPPHVVRASIGPITSATLREIGLPPHVEAPEATVSSLAETLVKYFGASQSP